MSLQHDRAEHSHARSHLEKVIRPQKRTPFLSIALSIPSYVQACACNPVAAAAAPSVGLTGEDLHLSEPPRPLQHAHWAQRLNDCRTGMMGSSSTLGSDSLQSSMCINV